MDDKTTWSPDLQGRNVSSKLTELEMIKDHLEYEIRIRDAFAKDIDVAVRKLYTCPSDPQRNAEVKAVHRELAEEQQKLGEEQQRVQRELVKVERELDEVRNSIFADPKYKFKVSRINQVMARANALENTTGAYRAPTPADQQEGGAKPPQGPEARCLPVMDRGATTPQIQPSPPEKKETRIALTITHGDDGYWLCLRDPETRNQGMINLETRASICTQLLARCISEGIVVDAPHVDKPGPELAGPPGYVREGLWLGTRARSEVVDALRAAVKYIERVSEATHHKDPDFADYTLLDEVESALKIMEGKEDNG